jgi:hypothetical protein
MVPNAAQSILDPDGRRSARYSSLPTAFLRTLEGDLVAERRFGGITVGGIIVIVGVIVLIFWSFWIGLIIALIGLIAFGGFARGKWY